LLEQQSQISKEKQSNTAEAIKLNAMRFCLAWSKTSNHKEKEEA